jgi:hypothetical protein
MFLIKHDELIVLIVKYNVDIVTEDLQDPAVIHISRLLANSLVMNVDLSVIHETGQPITVQNRHLDFLRNSIFESSEFKTTTGNSSVTLNYLGIGEGITNEVSKPDSYWKDKLRLIRGVGEAKDTALSPVDGLRQAISYGTHIAYALLQKGIPPEDIIVPRFGTNGQLIQFGCLRVLVGDVPYFICLSKVLDLGDSHDRLKAAGYMRLIDNYMAKSSEYYADFLRNQPARRVPGSPKYFPKMIENFFNIYGTESLEFALKHYFLVMKEIFSVNSMKSCIAYPLCVYIEKETTGSDTYSISKCKLVFYNY